MTNIGRHTFAFVLACSCSLLSGESLTAGLTDWDRNRLADQIESAAERLDATSLPRLDRSKPETLRRLRIAKSFFQRKTSQQNSDAWLDYLNLEPLAEAIESDQSPGAIGREALALQYRLIGTAPGLELTVLRKLRRSVRALVASVRFRNPERSIDQLNKQLTSLAERIRELDQQPSADDAAAISAMIDILRTSGQASNVVQSLRETFSRPNAAILIGEQMVQTAVNQPVNQTSPVNDCILGTRVIGTATLNGTVTANLLPSVGAARIQVALTGNVLSNNIGHNGPVRVFTNGYGDVFASRTMMVSEAGIQLEPVVVAAQMNTQINSIQPKRHLGRRIVRRIARRRAAEQKPQADAIANDKFRTQISEQFTNQTDEQAALEIPDFMRDVRPVLKRLSLVEPLRVWGSTEDSIYIDATIRRDDQISTVVSRPHLSGNFAAAVLMHESAINNAATPVLAGRTLNEAKLAELMESVGREMPAPASDDEDDAPFEITFARLRPVVFEARDQRIRIGIRGTRFAQGSRELKRAMQITAVYQPEPSAMGGQMLRRIGDVDVSFPGNRRLSVSQAGLKSTMLKKFSDIFPEVLLDQPLSVPATVQLAAIRGRQFRPQIIDAKNGWLTIAIR